MLNEQKEHKHDEVNPLDPSYPLLEEFRDRAPGTYKHTQALLAIVENVCAAIDMDDDRVRLAVMYHDIGKMWAPDLFTENQSGDKNIHDNLDPIISYHLITRHVSDSITIMLANGFPVEVIKIISQHHGNTVLRAIFDKAKAINPSAPEEAFRYRTPKPDCIESLILMLCDQIEATSRSLYVDQKSKAEPATIVQNVYHRLHHDGQFDHVSMLLGNLKKIQAALIADVAGNFQKRVAYGSDKELQEPVKTEE